MDNSNLTELITAFRMIIEPNSISPELLGNILQKMVDRMGFCASMEDIENLKQMIRNSEASAEGNAPSKVFSARCQSSAASTMKSVEINNFPVSGGIPADGVMLAVLLLHGHDASDMMLNVNNGGGISVYHRGSSLHTVLAEKTILTLVFNRTDSRWDVIAGIEAGVYWN